LEDSVRDKVESEVEVEDRTKLLFISHVEAAGSRFRGAIVIELYCQEQVLLTGNVRPVPTCVIASADIDRPTSGPATFPFLSTRPPSGATNAEHGDQMSALAAR
jgi:hypothetical protein